MYDWFKNWSAKFKHTDIVRAVLGIIILGALLFILTACGTTGPSMTLATSHRGDGFIQVKQPLYQSAVTCTQPKHEVFLDGIHHSEIFKETEEVVYDGIRLGYTHNFGKWIWQN